MGRARKLWIRRTRVLGVVILCAALAATALDALSAAKARTSQGVVAVALRALAPTRVPGQVAVFMLPRALPPGATVSEEPSPRARSKSFRLKGRAWLFWEDQAYETEFAHPGQLLVIDARTQRVLARRQTWLRPLVNGRPPSFLATGAAYHDPRNMVYVRTERPVVAVSAHPAAPPPVALPRGALAHDCLVLIGNHSDPQIAGGFKAMDAFAEHVGLSSSTAAAKRDLTPTIDAYIRNGCKDILIYLAGHGFPAPGTRAPDGKGVIPSKYTTEQPTVALAASPTQPPTGDGAITAADLREILRSHPTINFKIKIESCFSGRFVTDKDPKTGRELAAEPNLWPLEVSSPAGKLALGPAVFINTDTGKETPAHDNPYGAPEFTNQDYHGLETWARSVTELTAHPSLARGIADSQSLGKAFNVATDPAYADAPFGPPSKGLGKNRDYAPPALPPTPSGYSDPTTFSLGGGGATGGGGTGGGGTGGGGAGGGGTGGGGTGAGGGPQPCTGDAYLNADLAVVTGDPGYHDYYFATSIPDNCDIGLRNNGTDNSALNWSADVHDQSNASAIYWCHDGPPGPPPGEAACPGGTSSPTNPGPRAALTQDVCTITCGTSAARWQIYFRLQSDSALTVSVRVHYSWTGTTTS